MLVERAKESAAAAAPPVGAVLFRRPLVQLRVVVEVQAAVHRAQVASAELRADQAAGVGSVHSHTAGSELVGPALYADALQLIYYGQHQADCAQGGTTVRVRLSTVADQRKWSEENNTSVLAVTINSQRHRRSIFYPAAAVAPAS